MERQLKKQKRNGKERKVNKGKKWRERKRQKTDIMEKKKKIG